jgi:two-component system LytT family sensor kinase
MKRSSWIVLLVATAIGLLSASQLFIARMGDDEAYTIGHAIIMQLPGVYLWALFVPLIAFLLRRFPRQVFPHLAFGVLIIVTRAALLLWFMHIIGHGYPRGDSYLQHLQMELRFSGLVHLFTYGVIVAVIIAWQQYRKLRDRELEAAQLSEKLAQAQLQALRMQIHPHFLFNALNAVNMLIRAGDKTRAVQAVTGLSDLLRHVIDGAPLQEVKLSDEIAFLDRYLGIEAVRFGDRLRVQKNISPDAQHALVPNLVLQPIVENAIRHGISERRDSGQILISAHRDNGRLVMRVQDDGIGINGAHEERVGLSNTRARLQTLYGNDHELKLEPAPGGGTLATVSIPYRA